jgi:hypothetical protein
MSPNVCPWGPSASVCYSPSGNTILGGPWLDAKVITPMVCGSISSIDPSPNVLIPMLSPYVDPWGHYASVCYSPSGNIILQGPWLGVKVVTPVVGTRDHGLISAYDPCTIPPLGPFWLSIALAWGGRCFY